MSDEYLWDRSGDPDPLVVELEDKLSGLAFEPVFLVEEPAPAPVAMQRPASSWRAYMIGSAVTAAAVACSVLLFWCGYQAGQDPPPPEPAAQPVVVGAPEPVEEAPREPPPQQEPPQIDVDVEAEPEEETPPEPMRTADARSVKHKARAKAKGSATSGSSKSSTSASKGSDLDVDCILDPKACGKGKASQGASATPSRGATSPGLPEKPSTSDIREGIAPVKAAARACGAKHGAEPGEKVKVKLSIEGATGTVTSVHAQPPHVGTPLGTCVASALKRAKFKRFRKPSIGAVYPVSM
jgi:outer membrane biosynthesis protein TonB